MQELDNILAYKHETMTHLFAGPSNMIVTYILIKSDEVVNMAYYLSLNSKGIWFLNSKEITYWAPIKTHKFHNPIILHGKINIYQV
jgi:hypothetical protein